MLVNSESVVVVSTTEIETGVSYKRSSKNEPTEGFRVFLSKLSKYI